MLIIMTVLIITGCAAGKTKNLPCSEPVQAIVGFPEILKSKKVAVLLWHREAQVESCHHEGLMQGKQYWMFGLSKEQKNILFKNAGEITSLSFITELNHQGLIAELINDYDDKIIKSHDFLITGKIEKIVLNTYGRGFKEGYGSAGNYWEATVTLAGLKVEDTSSKHVLFEGNIETYAKLQPCPVTLDWTMLAYACKSLNGALELQKMQQAKTVLTAASKGEAYLENFKPTYSIEGYRITPIEVAARKAAVELLTRIKNPAQ